jgi:hypothetical protein
VAGLSSTIASRSRARRRRDIPIERSPNQAGVGEDFDHDVHEGPKAAAHEDDPEPEGVGPPLDEMHDGDGLKDDAPAVDEPDQLHSVTTSIG